MRVTLDTNVLISGTFWNGPSFEIVRKVSLNEIELVATKETIAEYNKIINSEEIMDKSKEKDLMVNDAVLEILEHSNLVDPKRKFDLIKDDPDDNKLLECAFEGKAEFIISKDKHLLKIKEFEGIKIVSPEQFLSLIKEIRKN